MNSNKTIIEKLQGELNSFNILSTLHFSIYTSIFTINSVLFGVFGILISLNKEIDKKTILIGSVFCMLPMLLILFNYIFLRGNNLKRITNTLIDAVDTIENPPEELKNFREKQKKAIYIQTPYCITKILENASILITILNIFFFLGVIYVSNP